MPGGTMLSFLNDLDSALEGSLTKLLICGSRPASPTMPYLDDLVEPPFTDSRWARTRRVNEGEKTNRHAGRFLGRADWLG